ncbi:MAG: hypothetical protein J6I49_03785 [Bacteroidales bacterium]|nr:hypothetical protein [Bacteroidales bacterium]
MQTFVDIEDEVLQDDLPAEQRAYWSNVIATAHHAPVAPEACLTHEEYWSRLKEAVNRHYE